MTRHLKADICIIGAGSGGLSVAAGAAQLGRRVVLIEKGEMGGDCLNYGCVPSKALIAAAARAQTMRTSAPFGLKSVEPVVDFGAVMDHVRAVIAAIAPHDSQERFEGLGVTVIRAQGAFTGPRTVMAGDAVVEAQRFVIATGSSPITPPIPGIADVPYFTNETVFANRTLPRHLIVIGGGPIGIELAQAHKRLGAAVTIIEADTILNREDPEAVEVVRQRLITEGICLKERSKVARASSTPEGVLIELQSGEAAEGTHALVAAGRRANLDGIGLDAANIETDGGRLKLDKRLRTTNRRVFAVGDAAGGLQFTHVAGDHASTVIRNILFKLPAVRRDALAPRVTYCSPELASVGLSTAGGDAARNGATILRWPYKDNDRAQAELETEGFVKIFAGRGGRIMGATMVGENAGDEIGIWSFAVANGLKLKHFTNYIAPYPTRGEISKRVGGSFFTPTLFSQRSRRLISVLSAFD